MKSKTKIVVLHMKEIIYTAVFLALGILLIFLLYIHVSPNRELKESQTLQKNSIPPASTPLP